jgi:hypothetical protein
LTCHVSGGFGVVFKGTAGTGGKGVGAVFGLVKRLACRCHIVQPGNFRAVAFGVTPGGLEHLPGGFRRLLFVIESRGEFLCLGALIVGGGGRQTLGSSRDKFLPVGFAHGGTVGGEPRQHFLILGVACACGGGGFQRRFLVIERPSQFPHAFALRRRGRL